MFTKKLEMIFIAIVLVALLFLGKNYYNSYSFKHNDISKSDEQRILDKEQEVLHNMQKNYGYAFKFPLIITDKFKGRLYGLTSFENGEIKIYLNKKVMQESMDYMVESVIAHEYAHALLFKQGYLHTNDNGHSKLWQETCTKLGGVNCQQYVDQQEVIMSKMPFN